MTVFADVPLLLNCALVGLAVLLGLGGRRNTVAPKPAGQWLNESDSSDEDAASDIGTPSPRYSPVPVKLPSELVAEEAQKRHSLELSASLNSSPRRRSSPAPLSQAHAAIDISSPVGSPDTPGAGGFGRAQTRSLKHRKHKAERERQDVQAQAPKAHLPFLTVYRAHMMVMTVHCILAVDFSVFPRVLGKCEDFGTSLMDVGVGSFVFSLGIVSSKSFSGRPASPWIKTCIKALRTAAPVLALGFIRLLMVKGVEYPEHLTEYGVHWNFFFTLGLVPALCSMLLPLRRHVRWHALAIAIALGGYSIRILTR